MKQNQQSLAMSGVINAIEVMIAARDPNIVGHQRRVADLACAIAAELNIPEDIVESVRISGILHDIGKLSLPTEILFTPQGLSENEFKLIMEHPETGYNILKQIDFPWPVAEIVHQHHEKYDGSGYPLGLKGEEILLQARILCVANVVEAMTSRLPYRAALGIDAALHEISENRGRFYDEAVVDACIKVFKEKNYIITDGKT